MLSLEQSLIFHEEAMQLKIAVYLNTKPFLLCNTNNSSSSNNSNSNSKSKSNNNARSSYINTQAEHYEICSSLLCLSVLYCRRLVMEHSHNPLTPYDSYYSLQEFKKDWDEELLDVFSASFAESHVFMIFCKGIIFPIIS